MKKIRILRIITRLNVGGPAIHTVLLTSCLTDEQYESYLVTGKIEDNEADMSYFADKYGVKPLYLNKMSREIRLWSDFRAFMEIFRIIRKTKPDIVHTHTAKAGMLGRLAAVVSGVPIIIHTFHGNVFHGYFGKIKTKLFKAIERFLAKHSTRIIAISNQQKKELTDLQIAPPSKIEVIKLGFRFDNVIPTDKDCSSFRKKYNIPADTKLISIIGRLVPIKNHELFLSIAEDILKIRNDVKFAIIGDGELRKDLEQTIKEKGLSDKVFITGFIEDLKPVYADVDLVLLTSRNEGTPVALIEAMVCKKLVMSTKVGGVEDIVKHGVTGFHFHVDDKDGFVREIISWLDNPGSYDDIRLSAFNSVIENYSYETLVSGIKDLYRRLIEENR